MVEMTVRESDLNQELERWGQIRTSTARILCDPLVDMSLTNKPLMQTKIEEIGQELHKNLTNQERMISAVAGVVLIAVGGGRRGIVRWALYAAGTMLIKRGWSGECSLYTQMGIDRRRIKV